MKWRQEGYSKAWECWHVIDETGKIIADVFDEHAASVIAEAPERNRQIGALVSALRVYVSAGCPKCSGDCGAANPPPIDCPLNNAMAALAPFEVKA